jgi:hypothetical protein
MVRLVPREVAEQNASSAFNSSTETLTDFRIVRTRTACAGRRCARPQGAFRVFNRKSQGLVELDAQQTARSLRQIDEELAVAPGLQVTDNLRWRLLKRRFLIELADPVGIETPRGPRIIVPYLERKGLLVRRPVLGGVFVVAPDGSIEDLEPGEAARRPEIAATGRLYPDGLARRVQDAYAYRKGIWNAWFVHEDQTQISDTELNQQPYLIDFSGGLGPQWVTVAEPYGRAFAASAIFLTDAVTGKVGSGASRAGGRSAATAARCRPSGRCPSRASTSARARAGPATSGWSSRDRSSSADAWCTWRRSSPSRPTRSPRPWWWTPRPTSSSRSSTTTATRRRRRRR